MMLRIIAIILGVGFLTACDNGPTGPTTFGGEVELETVSSRSPTSSSCGQGYNFVRGRKVKIASCDTDRLGELSDIDLWDNRIYAKPKRIYLGNDERVDSIHLGVGESATFKLRALKDKARCEITIKCASREYIPNVYVKHKFFIRFKIEIY